MLLGAAALVVLLLGLVPGQLLVVFALVLADGVVPLVPGEAALLAQAPAALAAGWPAVLGLAAVAACAAFLGDLTTYFLGRRVGIDRFAWQRRRRVARVLTRTGAELDRRGLFLIVSARLLPGWRVAISFMAGATGLSLPRFLAASGLGAALWAGYLLGMGSAVGSITGGGPILVAVVSLAVMSLVTGALRWLRRGDRRGSPLTRHREPEGPAAHSTRGAARASTRASSQAERRVGPRGRAAERHRLSCTTRPRQSY